MACVSTETACTRFTPGGSTKTTWLAHCRLVPLAFSELLSSRMRNLGLQRKRSSIFSRWTPATPPRRMVLNPASSSAAWIWARQ